MPVDRAPMMRVCLAEDPDSHRSLLALQTHHLVLDHETLARLAEEVGTIARGEAGLLPEPVPFREFVARACSAASGHQDGHERYFADLLGDVTEPTVPFGLVDVHGDGAGVREAGVALDEASARGCAPRPDASARARRRSSTWCGRGWSPRRRDATTCVFGTVLLGRMDAGAGADRSLGLFINTLPVRVRTAGIGATDAVRAMQEQLAGLLAHEHAPLALALRASGIAPQTPSVHRAVQLPAHRPARHRSRLRRSALADAELLHGRELTNYPLALSVDDLADAFALTVQARTPVDPGAVCAMVHTAAEALVDALEHQPRQRVDQVAVLSGGGAGQGAGGVERHRRVGWRRGRCRACSGPRPRLTPDAVAVMFGQSRVSYAELNAHADRLAHYLVGHGVGPERLVAVFMDRSVELVVALLAIAKAGGAYVPIDPRYPVERVRSMLDDARPVLALCDAGWTGVLAEAGAAFPVVAIDDPTTVEAVAARPATDPGVPVDPAHPAYVIYTSGSTGRPKGVAVTHAGIASLAAAHAAN